ncbi:MAG TPA: GNAT family N-acetyltransferase [Gemmatimonadaceae bacterium]|jgi:GNAT superfamily N-acetyltransferase|nr:GNAT family N-acetyltransferase [Gemmatimonadaceae bacterium]
MPLVRPATEADAGSMSVLFAQFEHPTPADPIPARLARLLSHDGQALVASDETGLLGIATTQIVWSLVEDAPRALLTALVVREDTRGRGVGRALITAVEHWARERGAERVVVTTALRRAGAHAFYERLGFEFTGRRYVKLIIR